MVKQNNFTTKKKEAIQSNEACLSPRYFTPPLHVSLSRLQG